MGLTSGAPWPRFAHSSGSSRNPYSAALSVHQTTPVEARLASKPACGRWLNSFSSTPGARRSREEEGVGTGEEDVVTLREQLEIDDGSYCCFLRGEAPC